MKDYSNVSFELDGLQVVEVKDFEFQDYDGSSSQDADVPSHGIMTCKQHSFLRWSTKNPYQRNVHYLGLASGVEMTKENVKYFVQDCPCPFSELVVIPEESK